MLGMCSRESTKIHIKTACGEIRKNRTDFIEREVEKIVGVSNTFRTINIRSYII